MAVTSYGRFGGQAALHEFTESCWINVRRVLRTSPMNRLKGKTATPRPMTLSSPGGLILVKAKAQPEPFERR